MASLQVAREAYCLPENLQEIRQDLHSSYCRPQNLIGVTLWLYNLMHELATCNQSERTVQSMNSYSSPVFASGPAV